MSYCKLVEKAGTLWHCGCAIIKKYMCHNTNKTLYYIPTITTADFTPLFYYQVRPDRFHY